MRRNITIRTIISAASLLLLMNSGLAQVKQPEEKKDQQPNAIAEEIDVVRAYKPVLAEAVKIRRSPDLQTTKPFKPVLTYSIPDKRLELNTDIRKLQAQELADIPEQALTNNYLSVGAGNLSTGTGEIYVNTGKDEALQAGAFFKHLNQEGNISGQQFSREQIGAYGRSIGDRSTLSGNLGYTRTAYQFYGFNRFLAAAPASTTKQHYDLVTLQGEWMNRYNPAANTINYYADAAAYVLKNAFKGKENAFLLDGGLHKSFGDFQVGATASLDFTSTADSAYALSNAVAKANPFLRLRGEKYEITTGVAVFRENLASRTTLLPAVTAEVQMVPGFATLFGAFTGSVLKTSLRGLNDENAFIGENLLIKNALERTSVSGGIKGNTGSGLGYKAMAYYKKIEGLPLFVNSFANAQKFDVVYDDNTEVVGFEGELSVNSPGVFQLTGKLLAASYKTSTQEEAWFKPGMQLTANGTFFINTKFSINGEVHLNGESKALVYTSASPLTGYTTKVSSFTDLSAGAEYRIKQKVGLYIRVNNLLNSTYERYLYYPVNGLNALGGLNYSF